MPLPAEWSAQGTGSFPHQKSRNLGIAKGIRFTACIRHDGTTVSTCHPDTEPLGEAPDSLSPGNEINIMVVGVGG